MTEEPFLKNMNQINSEISSWRSAWVHKRPCREWVEHERVHGHGFCKHLIDARHRKFGKRLEATLEKMRV